MDVKQTCCISCGQPLDTTVAGDQCLACLLTLAAGGGELESMDDEEAITLDGVLRQIGDYELEAEIARGGMGAVYRARQISLNRTVAIKMMIAGQLATPGLVRRFYTEAEAAAKLDHPNIVPIYEVGESETLHFFSMKLIEGRDLSQLLDSYSLAAAGSVAQVRECQRRIARLILKLADALAYAHDRGVLHRDIKPSNILIDTEGEPHLTDFGLAKLMQQVGTQLTLTSSIMGSPSYMAPEQAFGDSQLISTRADVYSLGAVLYELLTGRPPFLGKTAVETIRQVVDVPPPRPRSLTGKIHPDLETITLRCLEKDPRRRYASAQDVRLELQRFLSGESIVARPVGPMQELWRWANRNRRVALTAALLLLTLLFGTTGIAWQSHRAAVANRELIDTVSHLKWVQITELVKQGRTPEAVARLAALQREEPSNRQAAAYTMSILDQSRYHVPLGARIRHPDGAEISVAQFSPDESLLATGSVDRSVRMWHSHDGSPAMLPIVLSSSIENLSFNHDGTLIAIATSEGTLSIHQVHDGTTVFQDMFPQLPSSIQFARSSPDLFFTEGTALCCWKLSSSPSIRRIELNKPISSISVSSDGSRAVTLFQDRSASVWDMATGKELLHVSKFRILDAIISNNGQRLAATERNFGSLAIWDVESGQEICSRNTGYGDFDSLTFVADDERIVAASTTHQWSAIYSCLTGAQCGPPLEHQTVVTDVESFADGRYVMTLSKKNDLRFWNVETSEPYMEPVALPGGILQAGVSRTGKHIWTGTNQAKDNLEIESIQVWRLHHPQVPPDLSYNPEPYLTAAAAASSDGQWVVTCIGRRTETEKNFQAELTFVDAATGEQVRDPFMLDSDALTCAFTPDNQRLVTVTVAGSIAVFSVPDFQLIQGPFKAAHPIQPSRLSPDGRQLATGSRDGWVTLWDIDTLSVQWQQRHSTDRLNDLCFSADGTKLASCSNDKTGKVWEVATGALVTELIGHGDRIYHIRIDSAQQTVATGGDDNEAILWDLATGDLRYRLPHADRIYAIDFHPAQPVIVVASRDGHGQLWNTKTGKRVGRPMIFGQVVFNTKFSNDGERLLCSGQAGFQLWDTARGRPLSILQRQLGQYATGVDADGLRSMYIQQDGAVFCGALRYSSRIWKLKKLEGNVPEWFPDFLESIVMQRLDRETEVPELVETELNTLLREKVPPHDDSDYANWCRHWLGQL